jgi:predicted metal-binding protein
MEYTHKFSSGPLLMDHIIDEYFSLRKARGKCLRCPKYNKFWSCPEFGFDEKLLLQQFKYLYVIGREYEVPREYKQRITGTVRTKRYVEEVRERMNTESWRDLLEIEKDYPDTMTLRPGNCNICVAAGVGCAKKEHKRCRHAELMRFSMEALGLDTDSIAKFEIGMMLNWPTDTHLPEKISCLMGVMTNEKIPMAELRRYFPDAKKSYLKAGETILGGEDKPKAKRVDSWLERQSEEALAREEREKEEIWMETHGGQPVQDSANAAWTQDEAMPEEADEVPEASEETDENGQPKYKWLGFKRSVEEADEIMRERPIPKFNVKKPEPEPEPEAPAPEPPQSKPAENNIQFDRMAMLKSSLAEAIRKEMPNATDDQVVQLATETLMNAAAKMQRKNHIAPGSKGKTTFSKTPVQEVEEVRHRQAPPTVEPEREEPELAPVPERVSAAEQAVQNLRDSAPEPEPVRPRQAAPKMKKVVRRVKRKPAQSAASLPNQDSVGDVLGAALRIAKTVVSEPEPEYEEIVEMVPDVEAAFEPAAPAEPAPAPQPAPQPEPEPEPEDPNDLKGDDDTRYKWLGFKRDPDQPKGNSEAVQTAPASDGEASEAPSAAADVDPNDLKGDDDTRYKWLGFKRDPDAGDGFQHGDWRKKKNY